MTIKKIHDQYAYDSRGNPTVEVKLTTNKGLFRSIVPSGASTGSHEAIELRDGDKSKWLGKGVTKAVHNVNTVIAPAIIKEDMDIKNQQPVDDFLNSLYGTDNKSNLGTNTILGVSLSIARAAASKKGIPFYRHLAELSGTNKDKFVMPVPFLNVLNGGSHAGGALAFLFSRIHDCPTGAPSFSEGLRYASEVYHTLKSMAKQMYGTSAET